MNDTRSAIGGRGEALARQYMEQKGYRMLEQNYRTKYGEIDLIAKKDDVLIFVEVRTKTSEQYGSPEETINQKKLTKLYKNARAYVGFKKWTGSFRVDAVCVVLDAEFGVKRLEHHIAI